MKKTLLILFLVATTFIFANLTISLNLSEKGANLFVSFSTELETKVKTGKFDPKAKDFESSIDLELKLILQKGIDPKYVQTNLSIPYFAAAYWYIDKKTLVGTIYDLSVSSELKSKKHDHKKKDPELDKIISTVFSTKKTEVVRNDKGPKDLIKRYEKELGKKNISKTYTLTIAQPVFDVKGEVVLVIVSKTLIIETK